MTQEEYRSEFAKLLDIYKDSNMALNKNLVMLMSKYITELESPKTCVGCIYTSQSIDHFNEYVCDSCIRRPDQYDRYKPKENNE